MYEIIPGIYLTLFDIVFHTVDIRLNDYILEINCSQYLPMVTHRNIRLPIEHYLIKSNRMSSSIYSKNTIPLVFSRIVKKITQAVNKSYIVIIYCNNGIQISPTIMCAYLMSEYHMSIAYAYEIITEKSNIAFVGNIEFFDVLIIWNCYLHNARRVMRNSIHTTTLIQNNNGFVQMSPSCLTSICAIS
jgi:hypothetical protein